MSKFRLQHMAIPWHEIAGGEDETPAVHASLQEKSSLVGRTGLLMLSSGTGAWRVRASMNKIARALGISCSADIGLLSIEYTCVENGETYTGAVSLNTTGVNTDRIRAYETFADGFGERAEKYSVQQFHRILDKLSSMPANYKNFQLGLASALACACFTFLLGGGVAEMILAFFGAGVGNFIRKLMIDRQITLLANVSASVACACTVYALLAHIAGMISGTAFPHQAGYICSMLFIIPGFPLITGGIDLAKLDIRSGVERIIYAVLIITTASFTGWACACIYRLTPSDFSEVEISHIIKTVLRLLTSFGGVYGFSLMFNSPPKMALTAGVIGMTVNTLRLELVDFTGIPAGAGAFIGALCAGLIASLVKLKVGFPRITLTVPSIVIMVPGMFMYKGVYFTASGDMTEGVLWLARAFAIVLALPMGLIFARIFTDNNFRKSS